jgi:translation initiation factor IF-3
LSRPFSPRSSGFSGPFVRVNGKIRAREVRVVGHDGKQLGVLALGEAINLARAQGVDLVEIAPNATPPVCRLVDYGKFRYEQSKKEKEAKKHHHANKVKEIQLSPTIDPHDFGVKLTHAIDFLCDEMKVKLSLRFRGREMAHQEIGFQVVKKFIQALALYGHPDAEPKLIGRGIHVMLSPLPRNKRAKNPNQFADGAPPADSSSQNGDHSGKPESKPSQHNSKTVPTNAAEKHSAGFANSPFSQLDGKLDDA